MRHALAVVGVAVVAAYAALPARAQGTFPLRYQEAEESDLKLTSIFTHRGQPEAPPEAKILPKGLSEKTRYYTVPVGGRKVLALLDASSPPRLFLDAAGTGDFSAVKPLTGTVVGLRQVFGPVALPVEGAKDLAPVRVMFTCHTRSAGDLMSVEPAGHMAGEVKLGGQSYRVALADLDLDGRYDGVNRVSDRDDAWPRKTLVLIDLNRNGRFESDLESGETAALFPGLHVKGDYYRVTVAREGSSISLAKAEPSFGMLDARCPGLGLTLLSEFGVLHLEGGQGRWRVPAGWCVAVAHRLSQRDAAGVVWTLDGRARWGKLGRFEIRPGETFAVRAGAPLAGTADVGLLQDGVVEIDYMLVDRDGERYSAQAVTDGVLRQAPPALRILGEAGQVLASGRFEYW